MMYLYKYNRNGDFSHLDIKELTLKCSITIFLNSEIIQETKNDILQKVS